MIFPAFENYMGGKDMNALKFCTGNLTVWFSYKTPIAFQYKDKKYVRQNDWSTIIGKHLNAIDGGDKKSRISGDVFEKMLQGIIDRP